MSTVPLRWLLSAASLFAAQSVAAAPPLIPPSGGAMDASVAVPPVVHSSVFAGYRTYEDTTLRSWKEANDEVGRIGGWRAYAREAAAATTPAPAPTAPSGSVVRPASAVTPSAVPAGSSGKRGHASH